MKRYWAYKTLCLAFGLLLCNACARDFEEINTNPNVPNAVTPYLLLPGVIRETVNQVMGAAWGIGNIVMQQTAKIQFVNEDRYLWGEQNGIWNTMYTSMRDVNNMYTIADRAGQNNYKGITLVMKSWMFSLLTDANPIFTGNADNAALRYLSSVPNQFPLYTSRIGSVDEFRLSKTMADKLKELEDPRIGVFARPTVSSVAAGKPEYVGVPNGLGDNEALQYNGGVQNVSRIGTPYYIDGFGTPGDRELNIARGIIMTYAELQFILAEAAQRGLIASGTAKNYYESGVTASFNFYGLEAPAGYLSRPGVALGSGDPLQLIATQKWIALFYSGLETWFDWRRTGLPEIKPGPANLNENRVPVRFIYPTFEFSLNKENVEAAISRQGPNTINTPVWWDK